MDNGTQPGLIPAQTQSLIKILKEVLSSVSYGEMGNGRKLSASIYRQGSLFLNNSAE